MPSGRIEQQIDLVVRGLQDVKDAQKAVDKIDGTKAKVTVTADATSAQRTVKDVLADVKKLDGTDAQIVLAIRAAAVEKELSDILADVAAVDGDQATIDVELAHAAQLRGDLDELQGAIKEIDGTTATVDIDTKGAQQGLGKVVDGADQANSAVANMVGNSAQDLASLGGVAGSAGVAVGQLAEYFTDTAFAAKEAGQGIGAIFKSFAGAAAPIAVISGLFALFTSELNKMKAASEFNAKQIDDLFATMQDGKPIFEAFRKTLEETGKFKFPETGDILPQLNRLNISVEEFARLASLPGPQLEAWAQKQHDLTKGTPAYEDMKDVVFALAQAHTNADKATARHDATAKALGEDVQGLNKAYADAAKSTAGFDRVQQEGAATLERVNTIMDQAVAGTQAYDQAVSSVDFGKAALDGANTAMAAFTESNLGLANWVQANTEAWNGFATAIKESHGSLDVTSEKGAAAQDALEGLAHTVDQQLADAYTKAAGNGDTFRASAAQIADTLRTRLQKELGLSTQAADEVIRQLGLMPDQVETRYQLAGTEEARIKIGLLQGAIDNLPKDVQTQVTQHILAGDYTGALAVIQNYYNTHHAELPTDAKAGNTSTARQQMQGEFDRNPLTVLVTPRPGSIAVRDAGGAVPAGTTGLGGETGPEFVTLPDGRRLLLTAPTFLPARSRVTRRSLSERMLRSGTSPGGTPLWATALATGRPIKVDVKVTGMAGNRFEVDRAIKRSVRDGIRLAGNR